MTNNSKNNPEPLTFFGFLVLLTGINTLLNSVLFVGGIFIIYWLAINDVIAESFRFILWFLFLLPIIIIGTMILSVITAFMIKSSTNLYTIAHFMIGAGVNFLLFTIVMLWGFMIL